MYCVQSTVQKKQRWDRLEVQTKRHVQVLGGHLAEMEGAATCAEPFRFGVVGENISANGSEVRNETKRIKKRLYISKEVYWKTLALVA